jgi:hypothetical protein
MNRKLKLKRISIVALATLSALLLLALCWPRLQASYRFLPVDLAIERYYDDREIPSRRLLTLMKFARQAIGYHDHYRYHDALSLLHYLRAIDLRTPALERRDAYRLAEAEAVETVKRAPAQPEAWLRISTVRAILHEEADDVIETWKMSVFTGRTHSTLMVPRIDIGLPYLEFMDAETRSMLRDQLLLAWGLKPNDLLRVLKIRDPGLEKTHGLLGLSNPSEIGEMEVRLEKIR